ncbi:MAG: hypothetical protein DRJ49_07925 [Thermoprotei archaeon]|nr:MAG: hypothetical protein DRJ49_07925 [Thermoprotei archaeon]
MIVIRIQSTVYEDMYTLCSEIADMCKKLGINVKGPIYLPTKVLVLKYRRRKKLKVYRCKMFIECNESEFRRLLKTIEIPKTIRMEITVTRASHRESTH